MRSLKRHLASRLRPRSSARDRRPAKRPAGIDDPPVPTGEKRGSHRSRVEARAPFEQNSDDARDVRGRERASGQGAVTHVWAVVRISTPGAAPWSARRRISRQSSDSLATSRSCSSYSSAAVRSECTVAVHARTEAPSWCLPSRSAEGFAVGWPGTDSTRSRSLRLLDQLGERVGELARFWILL